MSRQALGEREGLNAVSDTATVARHASRRMSTKPATSAPLAKVERPHTGPDENDSLEVRLGDLIQRHQASKTKHSTEVSALQQTIAELKRSFHKANEDGASVRVDRERLRKERDDARKRIRNAEEEAAVQRGAALEAEERTRRLEVDIIGLDKRSIQAESDLSEAQAKIEQLRRDKAALEVDVRHKVDDRRSSWEKEKLAMQAEMDRLRNENARLIAREDREEEMEDERERIEEALEVAAEQCGRMRLDTVAASVHRQVTREMEALRLERIEKRTAEHVLRMEVRGLRADVHDLHDQLRLAESGRQEAEEMVRELVEQRRLDRELPASVPTADFNVEPLHQLDTLGEIAVEYRDTVLDSVLVQQELRATLSGYRDLLPKYHKSKETLAADRAALTSLRQAHKVLEDDMAKLHTAHDTCETRQQAFAAEVARWQHAESTVSEELAAVKEEKHRLESKSKREREEWKRANEAVVRSMAAESAFHEEITQLRQALDSAAEYEDLYNAMMNENEELAVREQLAAEEAERLGIQNAHLIGHGNGGQKISYVESVRREMALTKHELVSVRHQLNRANEKVASLTEEVESYRSISNDLGLGGSTRTRVVRRAPEGSWLAKSARGPGRSVSGPVAR